MKLDIELTLKDFEHLINKNNKQYHLIEAYKTFKSGLINERQYEKMNEITKTIDPRRRLQYVTVFRRFF